MKTKFSRRILAFVLAIALVVPMLVFNISADAAGAWTLVTDVNDLAVGDKVIIAAAGTTDIAMSTTQNGNNRGKAAITKDTTNGTATITETVQQFELRAGNIEGTFAFYDATSAKYLYSTLNGSNYLRSQTNLNDAASWSISITSSGVATVKAGTGSTDSTYRNWMRYNSQSSLFSCYGSGQNDISIYKFVEDTAAPFVSISGDGYVLAGNSITLSAELTNLSGDVAWSSSNTDVATVANGVVSGLVMGKTTISAEVNGTVGTKDVVVYPTLGELSIADAIKVCELTGEANAPFTYSVMGVIENINTAYDSEYKNITVTIGDGTNSIQAYRMSGGEGLVVGDRLMITGTLVNYKSNTPQFIAGSTYTKLTDENTEAVREAVKEIASKMSLAYKYEATVENVTLPSVVEITDTLNRELTGVTGTTYTDWSGKKVSSDAVYAGQSAGGNTSIQLRHDTTKNAAGIITTASGGRVKSITVTWNNSTTSGRVLNIYASNTAYTSVSDLWDTSENQGTKVASFTFTKNQTTTSTYTFTDDYAYIGIRSNSGALYLDSIEIVWESEVEGGGETVQQTVYKNSEFAFRFGVGAAIADIEGVDAYGIKVTAGGNEVYYTKDSVKVWGNDGEYCFVTVNLGDIINDLNKLNTKFTVTAFVEVDGIKYESELETTYSVADMVAHYVDVLGYAEVEHLYEYLANNDLI